MDHTAFLIFCVTLRYIHTCIYMPSLTHSAPTQASLNTMLRNTNYSLTRPTESANFRQEHSYVHDLTTLHWIVQVSALLAQQTPTNITRTTVKQNVSYVHDLTHYIGSYQFSVLLARQIHKDNTRKKIHPLCFAPSPRGPASSMNQQTKMLSLKNTKPKM